MDKWDGIWSQEAVINELKSKTNAVREKKLLQQDEVYNGALEDILIGLKAEPYRRADAGEQSINQSINKYWKYKFSSLLSGKWTIGLHLKLEKNLNKIHLFLVYIPLFFVVRRSQRRRIDSHRLSRTIEELDV